MSKFSCLDHIRNVTAANKLVETLQGVLKYNANYISSRIIGSKTKNLQKKTLFRFFISVLALFVSAWCMNILPTSLKFKYVSQIFQRKSLVVGNYLLFQLYVQIAEVNLLCKPTSSYRVICYPKVISH